MSVLLKEKNNLSNSVINQKYQKNEYNNDIEKNENDIIEHDYFPELLDIKNEKELLEYEKKLYDGYSKDKNGWMYNNYEIIDNCRMRPPISYSDQLIYIVKRRDNNEIVAGVTVHANPNNNFITEIMGFTINKTPKTCEGLTTFIIDNEIFNCGIIMEILSDFIYNNIIIRGYNKIYSTTNEKHVRFHKNKKTFKMNDIEYKQIGKEVRSLLLKEVTDKEFIEVYNEINL